MPSSPPAAKVYVIDDEECVRRSMGRLFRSAGLECRCFPSVDEFLAARCPSERACIVSDLRMPGRTAMDLPTHLAGENRVIPVVFITANDTSEMREAAQRAGAAGYFRKPVDDQALLDAVHWAIGASGKPGSTPDSERT